MARSLIVPVKTEFVALLDGSTDLIGVDVTYGHPGLDLLADEAIYPGEVVNWEQQKVVMASRRREETFDLVVRFLASKADQDAGEADLRVLEMFDFAADIVDDPQNFSDLRTGTAAGQLLSILLVPTQLDPYIHHDAGRVAMIQANLRVKGRV